MVKTTDNRFPTASFVSVRDLSPPSEIVDPIFHGNPFFPHSVFLIKPPQPFSLEGFIHFTKTSNAKATLMFQTTNIIPIDPMKTSVGFIARPKEISNYFS